MAVEFWFEFASTYSYPAALRIEALARSEGVPIVWKPFLLGPVFRAQGWTDSPFNLFPAKGRYMWRDLERICAELSIPFRRPSQFPRNGLLAARIACWFATEPWVPEFIRSVYRANFAEDLDISIASLLERRRWWSALNCSGGMIGLRRQYPGTSLINKRAQSNRLFSLTIREKGTEAPLISPPMDFLRNVAQRTPREQVEA